MKEFFVGRQPIIDHQGTLVAYDLFYQTTSAKEVSSRAKTSTLLSSVLSTFGTKSILGERRGLVTIDRQFLLSDLILSTPKELFVFSLMSDVLIDKEILLRVKTLREEGYVFALHDITTRTGSLKRLAYLFPYLSFLKVDMRGFSEQYLIRLKEVLSIHPIEIIATHVDDRMLYALTQSVGFPLIQGLYFAEPVLMENSSFESDQFSIIRIYNQLLDDSIPIEDIVRAFESDHALTIQLMQYINSSAFHFNIEIASVQHVLTLLGRKPLAQWLMLLIYGKSMNRSSEQLPLLLMVMTRTELMVGLLRLIWPNASKQIVGKAFFVGVMSLSSTVLAVPLRLILKEMSISEDVRQALLEKEGMLGEILSQVQAIERYDIVAMMAFAKKFEISAVAMQTLMTKTIENVNAFEKSM